MRGLTFSYLCLAAKNLEDGLPGRNLYLQTMKFGHLEGEPQPDPLGDENDNHGYEQLNNWDDPPQQQTHE